MRGTRAGWTVSLIVVAMVTAMALPAFGQENETTDPTPEKNVLYAHFFSSTWSMQTAKGQTSNSGGFNNPEANGDKTITLSLQPALENDLQFDLAGTVDFHVVIGHSLAAGDLEVTPTLKSGDTIVAQGEKKAIDYVAQFKKLDWSVAPALDTALAADGLTLEIRLQGAWVQIALQMDSTADWTAVTLPIIASTARTGDVIVFEGPALDLDFSFQNATTEQRIYSWNSSLENATVTYGGNATNGTFAFKVQDSEGTEVANGTLAAGGNASEPIDVTDAAPGNWTVTIDFTDFNGTASLDITAPGAAPGDGDDGDGGDGDDGDDDHGDDLGDGDDDGDGGNGDGDDKGSPAPALWLLMSALVVAVAASRRRD